MLVFVATREEVAESGILRGVPDDAADRVSEDNGKADDKPENTADWRPPEHL